MSTGLGVYLAHPDYGDINRSSGPQGWVLDVGLTTLSRKTIVQLRRRNVAMDREEWSKIVRESMVLQHCSAKDDDIFIYLVGKILFFNFSLFF